MIINTGAKSVSYQPSVRYGRSTGAGALFFSVMFLVVPVAGQAQTMGPGGIQAWQSPGDGILTPGGSPVAAGMAASLERVKHIVDMLAACRRSEAQLQASLQEAQAALLQAQEGFATERRVLDQRLSDARRVLAEKEQELLSLKAMIEEGKAVVARLNGESDRLRGQVDAGARAAGEKRARAEASALRVLELEKEVAQAKEQAGDLQRRVGVVEETHAGALAAMKLLQSDKSALEKDLAAERERISALDQSLAQERGAAGDLTAKLSAAEEGLASLQTELAAVQGQVADLEAKLSEAGTQGANLESELVAAQARGADLESRLGAVQGQTEGRDAELAAAQGQVAELEAKFSEAGTQRANLESELVAAQARGADLESRLGAVQGQTEGRDAELAAAQGQIAALEAKLAEAGTQSASLESELVAAQARGADLESRLGAAQGQTEGRDAELAAAQGQIAELEAKLADAGMQSANLESELAASREQLAGLEARNAEKQAAADERGARIQTLEAELAQAQQVASVELQDLRLQVETAGAERDKLRAALDESEAQLATVKGKLAQAQGGLDELRERLPVAVGGTLTDEKIQSETAEHFAELKALGKRPDGAEKAKWEEKRDGLEAKIQAGQRDLAESTGAQGTHRVEPGDTLAKISQKSYGKASAWSRIFEANRHLLEDPDRVFPGMTLVIP